MEYRCTICGKVIRKEASAHPKGERPASAGDHDSAYHVANAYHYTTGSTPDPACMSCHEAWPCTTKVAFVVGNLSESTA